MPTVAKKGFNHFDVLYYINLEHRTDRNEHILAELAKTGIDESKVHRIDAVCIKEFGMLGCVKSHIKTLEAFLQTPDEIQNCLILEDDFKLKDLNNLNVSIENLDAFFGMNIEYDVLMISGNLIHCKRTFVPFLLKVDEAQTTSGYCITKKFAITLLENFREGADLLEKAGYQLHEVCLDQYWKRLQKDNKWFAIYPLIGEQMLSYSDIEKKTVYYGC
jgi:GR25 family glycosyltransferase involved in LPS biosynthesis